MLANAVELRSFTRCLLYFRTPINHEGSCTRPEQRSAKVADVPLPGISAHEIRVRVVAVALNPVDSLYVYHPLGQTGRIVGSDFAGVVDLVGDTVPQQESGLRPGDRVAGFVQGACSMNDRPGGFAEYVVCPWDLVWKVEEGTRFQGAAAVSLCGLTAAQALFSPMGLKAPFDWSEDNSTAIAAPRVKSERDGPITTEDLSFFIYGATTSVGLYAAQLVRRSVEATGQRIKLFGAASSKHHSMLQAEPYGYDGLVDYRSPDWPTKIRELAQSSTGIDFAYDCISEGTTVSKTASTLAPMGKMAIVRSREGGAWTVEEALPVEPSYGAVWEGLGEMVQYQGMELPPSPRERGFAVAFYQWLSCGEGKLKPNPLREMPGGLEQIVNKGFKLLGSGSMGDRSSSSEEAWMKPLSAEKMVYTICND